MASQCCKPTPSLPKHTNPTTLNCQFISEKDAFEQVCRPILNKSKPKAEPPKQEATEPQKEAEKAGANEDNSKKGQGETEAPMEQQESSNLNGNGEQKSDVTMDLD